MDQGIGKKDMKRFKKKFEDARKIPPCKTAQDVFDISKTSVVKAVESDHCNGSVKLFDVSLAGKGPIEDKLFAESCNLHQAVTRGLTLMQVKGANQKVIARKGLRKFFDMQSYQLDHLSDKAAFKDNSDKVLMEYSLKEALDILKEPDQEIDIYMLEKANGENAQVSYIQSLAKWIICSKNVSLLAEKEEDIAPYEKDNSGRYRFAILIAQAWFKYLQQCQNVSDLKRFLSEHTLIGEYCGNQEYQHLVKYKEIQIRFYAIVSKDSQETCLHPSISLEKLEQFKLQAVKFKKVFTAKDFIEFRNEMKKLYQRISEMSVEEAGEGVVLYFAHKSRCLSLAKLKTLEYRLLRKLREKLRNFISQNLNEHKERKIKAYKKESEELCQFFQPKKGLEYYSNLAQYAFDYASFYIQAFQGQNLKAKAQLSSHFIFFLDRIKSAMEKQEKVEDLRIFQDMILNLPTNEDSENEEEEINQNRKRVFVLYFKMIPGSGKTFWIEKHLQQLPNLKVLVFSADELQKKCKGEEKEFDKKGFETLSNQKVKQIAEDAQASQGSVLIIIDKICLSGRIRGFEKEFQKLNPEYIKVIPKIYEKFQQEFNQEQQQEQQQQQFNEQQQLNQQQEQCPFSLLYLLHCLQRVLNRQEHQVMQGDPQQKTVSTLYFFNHLRKESENEQGKVFEWRQVQNTPVLDPQLRDSLMVELDKLKELKKEIEIKDKIDLELFIQGAMKLQFQEVDLSESTNELLKLIE